MKLQQCVSQTRPFWCLVRDQKVKQVSEFVLAITADPSCSTCCGEEDGLVPRYSNETAISQCGNETCFL
jgi:hypothetical protein